MSREYVEEICRKLRATASEFGQDALNNAVVIDGDSEYDCDTIGGHKFIYAPTISNPILAKCGFKVARFFEDA